ncbi:efflux transporter outer membrane subunit [Undibacterium sp. Di26W]|uniref:efflux transporter outer membrane subunit n=1 Tax=Undibacterium sp. Di26W TaxID=3413035 RepID=UPI003BF3A9B6
MIIRRLILTAGSVSLLAACATTNTGVAGMATVPAQWQAALPSTEKNTELRSWWQAQGDATLVELIDAAQAVSPSIAQAWSRIEAARAARVASGAALLPSLDTVANVSGAKNQIGVPVASTAQVGLQTTWELDLFGANRATNQAAEADLEGSRAQWHDARTVVAAEVAQLYFSVLSCRQVADITWQDARSRAETARVTDLSAQAGMTSNATASLTRSSAAEGNSRAIQQAAQCDRDIKALVAMTARPEPELRQKLDALSRDAATKNLLPLGISSVPAQVLQQRPDVYAAEKEVSMASSQIGAAEARRYPRLTLSGSIGSMRYRSMGTDSSMDTWSIGPLALTLPIFDGGQAVANVDAAKARYLAASSSYASKVRQAVREVEEALVNLQSTDARRQDSELAARGYAQALQATTVRYNQGMASLLELEDARRTAFASQSSLISLQLERNNAWIALYKALGGGWDMHTPAANPVPVAPLMPSAASASSPASADSVTTPSHS